MGALQPGLPSPAMLPEDWPLLIIDLKDCFFTISPLPAPVAARESHAIFHQNARRLSRAFKIPLEEARAIVKACPICSYHNNGLELGVGVNPRGLQLNDTWQM
ncbi:POK8 protein, partial [Ptilorrhoa leucosticta]|nr:POK8 protein [Ptilorrhoa leucosticta]